MYSSDVINNLSIQKGWLLKQCIDLGTTANIFIFESGSRSFALKTPRSAYFRNRIKVEYLVLQYLAQTPMILYIPKVYEWLPNVGGFLMEYLCYPNLKTKNGMEVYQELAIMLKTLHKVKLPEKLSIEDDRPEISKAICTRFCSKFKKVLEENHFWSTLPKEVVPKLDFIRERYPVYSNLLVEFQDYTKGLNASIIHGDLGGDNVMMTMDERLVLTDWGESRISTPLADIAFIQSNSIWDSQEINQFLNLYFDHEITRIQTALPTIQTLAKLYQYNSCVQSLLWLRETGDNGLDEIGKKHFDNMLDTL